MAVDFMHGRWPSVALEPQQRIDEVMQRAGGSLDGDGHFAHFVYLSSAVRWWTNALNSVNEQLIAHELRLTTALGGRGGALPPLETELTNISRALHSIAAHLHHYLSELRSVQSIAADLLSHYECVQADRPTTETDRDRFGDASRSTSQVLSQIEATHDFAKELKKKTQNILRLW
jgi:hypothetical protein